MCVLAGAQTDSVGDFQINSVLLSSSYPVYNNSGGKDTFRYSAAGIGIKSTVGKKLKGMVDLTLLFPYSYDASISLQPSQSFESFSGEDKPFVIDAVLGVSYGFDFKAIFVNVGGGFHLNALFDAPERLLAFGLGLDAQGAFLLGRKLTAQVGLKFNVDFFGSQSVFGTTPNFSGLPIGVALYTGFGIRL